MYNLLKFSACGALFCTNKVIIHDILVTLQDPKSPRSGEKKSDLKFHLYPKVKKTHWFPASSEVRKSERVFFEIFDFSPDIGPYNSQNAAQGLV